MFKIRTMNAISPLGLEELTSRGCAVGGDVEAPDALLLRSAELHGAELPPTLLAIARAGAGTNNIPVADCTERGIVVFNAPGANAEAVKELELCELVMASRDVLGSIAWVRSVAGAGERIPELVEKGKNDFAGPELLGKTLGVVGLGATGSLIANIALELGMSVVGHDPFLSVDAAWRLSREVSRAESMEELFARADYVSLNVPYPEEARHLIDEKALAAMKKGVRIINESRAEVVDDEAMLAALESGQVARYVTDFPNARILTGKNVIAMPHLGACTPESEDRCAVMAAKELWDYLLNGNVKNSVNLPDLTLSRMGVCRLCVIHRNVPRMITRILDFISERNINVEHMMNKPRGAYAYTVVDLGAPIGEHVAESIRRMSGVLRVRVI